MPLIHVDIMSGRTTEQHRALIRALTDACVETLGAPAENVRVVINEMTPTTYGIGGRTFLEVAAERATSVAAAPAPAGVPADPV